jgi:hypothetical protein
MEFYQTRVVIAYFVGGRKSSQNVHEWALALVAKLKEECKIGSDSLGGSSR